MTQYSYSRDFNPPAPVLPVRLARPGSPGGLTVMALIDSGAFITVLPSRAVQELRLPQVDLIRAVGAFDDKAIESKVFAAEMATEFVPSEIVRVITFNKSYALLGRDLLNGWKLALDGPKGLLEITA